MFTLLPELTGAVGAGCPLHDLGKGGWQVLFTVISQLPPGELAHIAHRVAQPVIVKVSVEQHDMGMGGHDDKGVATQ